MQLTWTCKCCGRSFNSLPMSYAAEGPDNWYALSGPDRAARTSLGSDLCVIDQREFYVRGCVEVPVADCANPFVWNLWVSVSQESFGYIGDRLGSLAEDDRSPRFGWLCTSIRGYPTPLEIRCHVFLRAGNLLPRIVLEPTDYPLAAEQHAGITLERAKAIAAEQGH